MGTYLVISDRVELKNSTLLKRPMTSQPHKMPRGYNWFPEWIPLKELPIKFTSSAITRLLEEGKERIVVRLYTNEEKLHVGLDQIQDSIRHLYDIGMKLDDRLYLLIDERQLDKFTEKNINYNQELREFTICSRNQSEENLKKGL